jgi:glycine cleavage system T protein (aminomethyltransferase)
MGAEMTRVTPFHSRTSQLCEGSRWEEWEGFLAAASYALDYTCEYDAVRWGCGMFDVSPLYKYDIRGSDAKALMQRIVVRDLAKSRPGRVFYSVWCDDKGMVMDDGTVFHLAENHFRMSTTIPNLYWLQDNAIGLDVEIEDVSEELAGIALQGPTSRDLLKKLTRNANLDALRFFHCTDAEVAGAPALISRTGYTGDLGYEIFIGPQNAERLWDSIMDLSDAYKLRPAGLLALNETRLEAGLIQIEADFISASRTLFDVQKTSPFELGLDWMINLNGDFFVGQSALRKEKQNGSSRWTTVGIELDVTILEKYYREYGMPLHLPERGWVGPVPIYSDEAQEHHIGRGTSGTWSRLLKKYIAIARIEPRYGKPGSQLFIEEMVEAKAYSIPATVVKMPFFDPPRKKSTGV